MAELTSLRNIGKGIEKKLKSIDITTAEELINVGSEEAFIRLKFHYPNVCAVYLQALEGAVLDCDYNQLPDDVKQRIKKISDSFK